MKQEVYNIIARRGITVEKDRKRWIKPKEATGRAKVST